MNRQTRMEQGQALSEYSLIIMLVVLAGMAAVTTLGQSVVDVIQSLIPFVS